MPPTSLICKRQMSKIAFVLIYASAVLFFLTNDTQAEEGAPLTPSLDKTFTVDAEVTNENTQLRSGLIAWLAKRTGLEIPEIEKRLVLNRSLESKVCPGDLFFEYVQPHKRLITADCKNHWRRFIKHPAWLKPMRSEPVVAEAESTKLQAVLLIKKAVTKGERVLDTDLEEGKLALTNYKRPDILKTPGIPLIAAKDLSKGQPVELGDILAGKKVVVSKTTIPAGSGISDSLVMTEFRVENVPSDAIDKIWPFMETNRRIAEGDILRERHLIKAKLVRRNDPVTLIHKSPALQIITTGVSLQDGYFGQSVKVLNTESGRNVMGVVAGRGKVVIESGD